MQYILLLCQDNYLYGGQSILPVEHLISKHNFAFLREISVFHAWLKGLWIDQMF